MKKLRLSPLLFRRIHKWVGLILGLQFLLWALSGSVMALLDKDKVGGHGGGMSHSHPLPPGEYYDVAALPDGEPVTGVVLRDLGARPVYEVESAKGTRLVDATTGEDIRVDQDMARALPDFRGAIARAPPSCGSRRSGSADRRRASVGRCGCRR